MTVTEFISLLKQMPQDSEILFEGIDILPFRNIEYHKKSNCTLIYLDEI